MKKILVFEVNWLGDILFSSPVFKTIKDNQQDVFLGCVVAPRGQELLKYNPYIDEVIVFDERETHRTLKSKLEFVKMLRLKSYDEVYLLHRSFTRALLCLLGGIKRRVGYSTFKRRFILTHPVRLPKKMTHKQDYYLNILERSGFVVGDRVARLYISEKERKFAQRLLGECGVDTSIKQEYLIALNPGANWIPKRWPFFAELVNIIHENLNAHIFLTGAEKDRGLIEGIYKGVYPEYRKRTVDLSGKTSLLEIAAVFELMDCVVSSDSGPLHIAASVGSKIVGIYGPTSTVITGPRTDSAVEVLSKEVNCRIPCYVENCTKDRVCLRSIEPQEVFESITRILKR